MLVIGGVGEDGVMAGGMQAEADFGAGRSFDPQALGADGDASVVTHAEEGALAPDLRPPRTRRDRTQDGAFFFQRRGPRLLRGRPQFALDFLGVVRVAQRVDGLVGFGEFGDFFAGEVGGPPPLPERVFPFDLALGLGRGGVAQAEGRKTSRRCPAA